MNKPDYVVWFQLIWDILEESGYFYLSRETTKRMVELCQFTQYSIDKRQ